MYDGRDPAQRAALKTELETDPAGVGYDLSAHVRDVYMLLNDATANPGGETTTGTLTARLLWELMAANADDLGGATGLNSGQQMVLNGLLNLAVGPEDNLAWAHPTLTAMLPPSDFATAVADITRSLSRAEALFGIGTHITADEISQARNT